MFFFPLPWVSPPPLFFLWQTPENSKTQKSDSKVTFGLPAKVTRKLLKSDSKVTKTGQKVTEPNLRKSAVSCENLRFSVVSCALQRLEFPGEGVNLRKSAVEFFWALSVTLVPSPYISAPWLSFISTLPGPIKKARSILPSVPKLLRNYPKDPAVLKTLRDSELLRRSVFTTPPKITTLRTLLWEQRCL